MPHDDESAVGAENESSGDVRPRCSSALFATRYCKLPCTNRGYVESCEDTFPADRHGARGGESSSAARGAQL